MGVTLDDVTRRCQAILDRVEEVIVVPRVAGG